MEISRIQGAGTTAISDSLRMPKGTQSAEGTFGGMLQDAIIEVDRAQSEADQSIRAMMAGEGEDLHSTMIAVQKASLSFELMMQVRNKVVSAYQEIARMQF